MTSRKQSIPRQAFTVSEFCAAHGISRVTFYRLQRVGDAPEIMRVGRKVLITARDAEAWQDRLKARTRACAA